VTCGEADMIIGYKYWGASLPRIWEGKNNPKFGEVLDNFRLLITNISGTDGDIDKPTTASTKTLPRSTRKIG